MESVQDGAGVTAVDGELSQVYYSQTVGYVGSGRNLEPLSKGERVNDWERLRIIREEHARLCTDPVQGVREAELAKAVSERMRREYPSLTGGQSEHCPVPSAHKKKAEA